MKNTIISDICQVSLIDEKKIIQNLNSPVLDKPFYLSSVELFQIINDMSCLYNVSFDVEDFMNSKFTFNDIIGLFEEKLKSKDK